MSSFSYGNHTRKHIGVWLRYHSNQDLVMLVKESGEKRFFDTVTRVVVVEYDKEYDEVFLQFWCKNLIDSFRGKTRYSVFHIRTKVNPDWVCEGDLGNGIKF